MCAAPTAARADERGLGDSDEEGEDEAVVSWQAAVRALLWSVYIPGTIRALGQQSLDPFVPLFAKRLGATVSEAGVVSSISFAANALCSPVAGILVANTGSNCAMLLGVAVNVGAALLGGLSPSVLGLSVSRGLTGAGNGVFQVGRQVQLTNDVPNALRGRVQSLQVRANPRPDPNPNPNRSRSSQLLHTPCCRAPRSSWAPSWVRRSVASSRTSAAPPPPSTSRRPCTY